MGLGHEEQYGGRQQSLQTNAEKSYQPGAPSSNSGDSGELWNLRDTGSSFRGTGCSRSWLLYRPLFNVGRCVFILVPIISRFVIFIIYLNCEYSCIELFDSTAEANLHGQTPLGHCLYSLLNFFSSSVTQGLSLYYLQGFTGSMDHSRTSTTSVPLRLSLRFVYLLFFHDTLYVFPRLPSSNICRKRINYDLKLNLCEMISCLKTGSRSKLGILSCHVILILETSLQSTWTSDFKKTKGLVCIIYFFSTVSLRINILCLWCGKKITEVLPECEWGLTSGILPSGKKHYNIIIVDYSFQFLFIWKLWELILISY